MRLLTAARTFLQLAGNTVGQRSHAASDCRKNIPAAGGEHSRTAERSHTASDCDKGHINQQLSRGVVLLSFSLSEVLNGDKLCYQGRTCSLTLLSQPACWRSYLSNANYNFVSYNTENTASPLQINITTLSVCRLCNLDY
jgi:hypothetical protein